MCWISLELLCLNFTHHLQLTNIQQKSFLIIYWWVILLKSFKKVSYIRNLSVGYIQMLVWRKYLMNDRLSSPKFPTAYNKRGATGNTRCPDKPLLRRAFRASFTLSAAGHIAPRLLSAPVIKCKKTPRKKVSVKFPHTLPESRGNEKMQ